MRRRTISERRSSGASASGARVPRPESPPTLWVVAGPNGAGKSSVVGEMIRQSGGVYFNPDEVAQRLQSLDPALAIERANELAWTQGRTLLERSIETKSSYAFETTLGGSTMS